MAHSVWAQRDVFQMSACHTRKWMVQNGCGDVLGRGPQPVLLPLGALTGRGIGSLICPGALGGFCDSFTHEQALAACGDAGALAPSGTWCITAVLVLFTSGLALTVCVLETGLGRCRSSLVLKHWHSQDLGWLRKGLFATRRRFCPLRTSEQWVCLLA